MCNCGCNSCDSIPNLGVVLNESIVKRDILSENLRYHVQNKLPLTENTFRYGSDSFINLWAEARALYLREILNVNEDDKEILTETDLGNYGMFEGNKVPLDLPMLEESYDYDEVAQAEFGMDYDQLGSGEKEWVRDEIDNMSMDESLNEKEGVPHYTKDGKEWKGKLHKMPDGSLMSGNPHDKDGSGPNGESEKLYHKEDLNESDSNYPDFDLNKNIRYQDTSISSGMWRYTGKEQGGKGVYRNLMNDQFLGFSSDDFDFFKKHLGSHFDIPESINEVIDQNLVKGIEVIKQTLSKEGGAAGLEPLVKELVKLGFKKDEVVNLLKDMTSVKQHRDGDYILLPLEEAKNDNKKLNKPTRDSSGGKAYKVYVKDPKTGNIKTVRFGSGGLRAKINDKKARNAFAARHKCSEKKDKTKAGYWSCRLPRYAKLLGLKSSFSGFW